MKKRIMAALLAVMMLAALLPTAAVAAPGPADTTEKLPTPELSAWEEDSGIISWGIADSYSEYMDDYYLKVRYKEAVEAEDWTELTEFSCNQNTVFSPHNEGYFQVQVQAKSKNPEQYSDSEWSEWSVTYHRGPIDQDFLNKIGGKVGKYLGLDKARPSVIVDGTTVTVSVPENAPERSYIRYSILAPGDDAWGEWQYCGSTENYSKEFTVTNGSNVWAILEKEYVSTYYDSGNQQVTMCHSGANGANDTYYYGVGKAKIDTPTELRWGKEVGWVADSETGEIVGQPGDDVTGLIYWRNGQNAGTSDYELDLYKKGEASDKDEIVYTQSFFFFDEYKGGYLGVECLLKEYEFESGTYYYTLRITSYTDSEFATSDTARSDDFTYVKPSQTLPTPTMDPWNGSTITGNSNAESGQVYQYVAEVRYKATTDAAWETEHQFISMSYNLEETQTVSFELDDEINDPGYYSVRIRTLSTDISEFLNSDWSDWSDEYYFNGTVVEPSTPSQPSQPSWPSVPGTPSTPSTPSTPGTPSEPDTPSTPETPATTFTDVPEGEWYAANVAAAAEEGLIAGYGDGSFHPTGELTWAQTVTFAFRIAQKAAGEDIYGPDDQTGTWYDVYVDYAKEHGLVGGLSDDPNAVITRADAAVIFAAALGKAEKVNDVPNGYFTDVEASGPVHDAVYALAEAGIINGKTVNAGGTATFGASDPLLRREVATIIARMAGLTDTVKIG